MPFYRRTEADMHKEAASQAIEKSQIGGNAMKIASYVLLGLLSCVEVLAGETAFDRAVEAYRTYKNAQYAYFEARDIHEETRLAWDAYRAADLDDTQAHKKAKAAWAEARDANKEVKGAYAIFQITGKAYHKAFISIPEVKLAWDSWEEALDHHTAVYRSDASSIADYKEADRVAQEAEALYEAVAEVFKEAIKKAYEKGEKNHRDK